MGNPKAWRRGLFWRKRVKMEREKAVWRREVARRIGTWLPFQCPSSWAECQESSVLIVSCGERERDSPKMASISSGVDFSINVS